MDKDNFQRIDGYNNGSKQSILSGCTEPFEDGYSTEKEEYEKMVSSVEANNGFYIGRYETGKDKDNKEKIVVQKDVDVYNYIGWSNSDDMNNETGGAVEKAKGFKIGKAYENSVTSTLIYGVQWDATMQFFDNRYIEGIPEQDIKNSYVSNSEEKGNYKDDDNTNNPTKTGTNDNYCVKNIYDMAGNVSEWTMEAYSTDHRVSRGGHYNLSGFNGPASNRDYSYYFPSNSRDCIGFRIALYLGL